MNTQAFPQTPGGDKIKSYWNRPGGKFGTIAALAGVGAGIYFLLPILTTIVWNTINFGIACAAAFALYMLLSNRKLWLSLFYLYEILIKKLVGIVIELDPFIIAEDYIGDIEKEREHLYEKSVEVDGQKEGIDSKIREKQRDLQKEINKAAGARNAGMAMELANTARQIARLEAYIQQLTPIRDNLQRVGDYLTQVHKNSKYMLDDMKNELDLKKDLYYSVTKGNDALKSAMSVFSGDAEKRLMMEQSMDYLKDDIAGKLASMKKAISYSSDFMKSIDLENATYQAEGIRMLEEYKPELFAYHPGEPKPAVLNAAGKQLGSSSYEDLLK